jgi:hypothetical protein
MSRDHFRLDNSQPRGTVLVFTLAILGLMSVMGLAIIMNTRTELNVSHNTYMGREAFTRADTGARVAIFVARIYMHPELGTPDGVFSTNSSDPLKVTITDDSFYLSDELLNNADNWDYRGRYIAAASRTDASGGNKPHLHFGQYVDGDYKTVATAALSIDHGEVIITGSSLDTGNAYDSTSGSSVQVILATTVNGRPPSGDEAAYEQKSGQAPSDMAHSVVTTLFREVMN